MILETDETYLSIENSKHEQIVTILTEGSPTEQPSKFNDKIATYCKLDVEWGDIKGNFTIWKKYKSTFVEAWGKDTKDYVGKQFKIFHINGKIEIKPIVVEKVQGAEIFQ